HFGRGAEPCELVERMLLLNRAFGNELRRKELPMTLLVATPTLAHEGAGKIEALLLLVRIAFAVQEPAGIAAIDDQLRHPLRMARSICDRNRGGLRDADQRK